MIAAEARQALRALLGERVRFDVPLARHTSLRVGGPADALAMPESRDELAQLLALCARHHLPHSTLGAGFNTLVRAGGVTGVVVQLGRLRRLALESELALRAEAGVSHNQLLKFCVGHGLGGLAFGAGIPGSIGGWVAMNAGVPEGETRDAVREIEIMTREGRLRSLDAQELQFVYRGLRSLPRGALVLSALFAVRQSSPAQVQAEVDRMLERRARTQPLDVPTCGSVFKNPPGAFAGRLIEEAGLKGRRIGGAEISPVHANFIANVGGATALDVLALIAEAQTAVEARTGIRLEPEVRIVGRRTE